MGKITGRRKGGSTKDVRGWRWKTADEIRMTLLADDLDALVFWEQQKRLGNENKKYMVYLRKQISSLIRELGLTGRRTRGST